MSLSQLSKSLKLSKPNISYKISRLLDECVIEKFTALVDIHKLGYLSYRVYIRLKDARSEQLKNVLNYFANHHHVLWLVTISGPWDIQVVFIARNYIHFNNLFTKVKQNIGDSFVKTNVSMSVVNTHYPRDYLLNKKRSVQEFPYYGYEPTTLELDDLDIRLLQQLIIDCRRSNTDLGRELGVSHHTIKSHISELEKTGVIQSFRSQINVRKYGYIHMKVALYLNDALIKEHNKLLAYIASLPNITYIIQLVGEWSIEIEADVKTSHEFEDIIKEIRGQFPHLIKDYFFFQVTQEVKLNYFPIAQSLLDGSI